MERALATALPLLAALMLAALGTVGCSSSPDREQQTERQRRYQELQRQQRQEAQRFAAVVYFDSGSALVDEQGRRELDWFVEKAESFPIAIVEVRGFTDATGSVAVNQELSRERARNVAEYLMRQGIDSKRIDVQSFGASIPAQPNDSDEGRKNNRRVEVTLR